MTRLPPPPPPEVVDRDDRLAELARSWLREPAVGLDTEFVRERTFFPRLGLIQVADSAGCYLVDTVAIRDRSGLVEVIRSRAVTKVFHSPSEDLEILHHVFGLAPERLFDCQVAATLCGLGGSLGYVHLVSRLFDVELAKGAQRSNWLRRPLSEEQVRYAGLDVAYLLPAYELLRSRLAELGREAWADEEFDRLLRAAEARLDPEWSFKRLGRPGMSRRQLAALRVVCEWRERRARRRDLPRGFVLRDETVLDLARRMPRSGQGLTSVKGLGPRQARRYGPALLDLVRGAAALPESDLPNRLERSGGRSASRLTERLRELVARVAGELDLPAETLVSRRTLEAWAARSLERGAWVWPGEIEGWRRFVLEPQVDGAGLLEYRSRKRSRRGRGRGSRAAAPRDRQGGSQ
ncbi:MAG: ribonuclease D [Acidobacteria bacterium]|nr:ribonuclease D [Acidobacteriota bacterium]